MKQFVTTKEELTEAMQSYNLEALKEPIDYSEIDDSEECAEIQVRNLISFIPEGKLEENKVEYNMNLISSFINHCANYRIKIEDDVFETFFNA